MPTTSTKAFEASTKRGVFDALTAWMGEQRGLLVIEAVETEKVAKRRWRLTATYEAVRQPAE